MRGGKREWRRKESKNGEGEGEGGRGRGRGRERKGGKEGWREGGKGGERNSSRRGGKKGGSFDCFVLLPCQRGQDMMSHCSDNMLRRHSDEENHGCYSQISTIL